MGSGRVILFSVPIFVLKKDPFLPDVFSVPYRNMEYRQPDGFCSCISSTCPFMKVLHCSVAEKTNILLQRSFFMTYNISGRKQNLTLQRCNCTPYLKRDIDIPANCTIISEKTFQNRSMIQSVSFPYGLKQIGSNAFSGCSRLKHLLLPESLCQIGKEAFSDCTTLSSIYIPQYISTISKGMLRNAHKLSETLFSSESRLLKIQADAFSECSALREISFPDSLQEIGNGSFYKCKNLSEVHFSENLKVIRLFIPVA